MCKSTPSWGLKNTPRYPPTADTYREPFTGVSWVSTPTKSLLAPQETNPADSGLSLNRAEGHSLNAKVKWALRRLSKHFPDPCAPTFRAPKGNAMGTLYRLFQNQCFLPSGPDLS